MSPRSKRVVCLIVAASFIGLTNFIQIHDEAIVKASGGAIARRVVVSDVADELEQTLEKLRAMDANPKATAAAKAFDSRFRTAICDSITSMKDGWDTCRWEGTALVVEKHYGRGKSPFSSCENSSATFALHHWLSNGITRPPFPLVNIGPVMQNDEAHRRFIRDLRDKGFALDLTIRMPGKIRYLWGNRVKSEERTVHVDLLEPWNEELTETFVESDRGFLYEEWFHFVVISVLVVTSVIVMRLTKPR